MTLKSEIKNKLLGARYRLFGIAPTDRAFWKPNNREPDLHKIMEWFSWFLSTDPDLATKLAEHAWKHVHNPITLLHLARDPAFSAHMKKAVQRHCDRPLDEDTHARLTKSQSLAASYVAAHLRILGTEAAQIADAKVKSCFDLPRDNYDRVLDSILYMPGDQSGSRRFQSGYCAPKAHRLIVMHSSHDIQHHQDLFRGAERITIIFLAEMYGKATLPELDADTRKRIRVEHIRTRNTRFSTAYHRMHAETRNAAELLVRHYESCAGPSQNIFDAKLNKIHAIDLADQIFFETLKVRALKVLLEDQGFDHIVIACQSADANHSFYRTLSCVAEIRNDARIEFTSTVASLKERLKIRECIQKALSFRPRRPATPLLNRNTFVEIAQDLKEKATRYVELFDVPQMEQHNTIMAMVTPNPSYDASTAAYINALAGRYTILGVFGDGAWDNFIASQPEAEEACKKLQPIFLSTKRSGNYVEFSRWLQQQTLYADLPDVPEDISVIIEKNASHFLTQSLIPAIVMLGVFRAWFVRLSEAEMLPRLIVTSVSRNMKMNLCIEEARRFDVPSMAVEPFGLNGNYCRYAKLNTDYYGVISEHFRKEAARDFAVPPHRCRVIGSPRILAPSKYDPKAAQEAAREALKEELEIEFVGAFYSTFFGQPSEWEHTSKVWRNILTAIKAFDITILLKLHPEESPARLEQYFYIAAELGLEDRILLVSQDANSLIAASDFVMTCYSAVAIDAAVLGTPVFCVTADQKPYPVDQHAIAHAPLCGSAAELEAMISRFVNDPQATKESAKSFMAAEPQFFEGFEERFLSWTQEIMQSTPHANLRSEDDRPKDLFLDGPFKVYSV